MLYNFVIFGKDLIVYREDVFQHYLNMENMATLSMPLFCCYYLNDELLLNSPLLSSIICYKSG